MAGAAGSAGGAGPAGGTPFSIPVNPPPRGPGGVRPPPVTPPGLSTNPLDYIFAKSLGLRNNGGQTEVVYMNNLVDAAADAGVDAADRLGLPRTAQNPTGTPQWLVPLIGQGRADWAVYDMPTTVLKPDRFSAEDAQGYFDKFREPLPTLGVNGTYFDLMPTSIAAFFVRYNDNTADGANNPGDLVMGAGPNGQPSRAFLHWGSFAGKVALIVDAILQQFSFPAGSFWGVAVHAPDHTMLFQRLSFDAPDLALVTTLLLNMSNGATSDGRLGYTVADDGMYFRVMIYNPSTGRGGQLPPLLRKKTKTVWNPHPGLPCGPQALMMALARHTESRSKVGHLKEREREMESYIEDMVAAVASPTDAWSYGELYKAVEWLRLSTGRHIELTVLDAHVDHVVLFDTVSGVGVSDVRRRLRAVEDEDADSGDEAVEDEGDGEEDLLDDSGDEDTGEHPLPRLRLFVMHDRVAGHFFTCFNPASLKDGRLWCDGCHKLYSKQSYKMHVCTKWACKLCGANHKTKEAFRTHFYSEEHVPCPTCERLMPPRCLEKHGAGCKGVYRRCPRCNECYTDATKTKNPRAITPEQHAEMCGKRMRFCGVCNAHREPEHVCVRPRRDDFGFNYDKQRQEHCALDIECMRGPRGKQVFMCASARFALPFVEGESLDDYNARHIAHHRETPALRFRSISDLCQWMVTRKRTTFVLHNMGGYDGPILLWYMRYEMGVNLDTLMDGLKVMLAQFGSNRMMDSLNHLTTSLAKMPKMFFRPGQCPDVAKQHFPHDFNTPENQDYEGPLPDREFYGDPGNKDLDAWHAAERLRYTPYTSLKWNLKKVCEKYCDTDALVLMVCWQAYRLSGILAGGVDPGGCVTAASFADKTWQHKDIPDEGVTSLPQGRGEDDAIIKAMVDDSFHGGRTEGFVVYKEVSEGHKLVVDDVTSMYPHQMTGVLPNGLPVLYVNPPDGPDPLLPPGCPAGFPDMVGIARVDIRPPIFPGRPHFRPVIGDYDKDTGRYVFDLYPKVNYAITLSELKLCLEHKYRLDRVHSVVVWPESDYVYRSFVYRFFKLKLESSAPIPEDKVDAFIEECQERYGFRPDRAALLRSENVALRALAKLLLNSSWGKQAQAPKATTQHVSGLDACKLFASHATGKIAVVSVEVDPYLKDRFAVKFYHRTDRLRMVDHKRNKAIATIITGNARCYLYKKMAEHEGHVLYVDTDSVFVEVPEDTPESRSTSVCPGVHLGEWASEVPEGAVWERMVVLGAKCYALEGRELATGKKIHKVRSKGIPMNSTAARTTVTFDNMKRLVNGELSYLSLDILHFRRQPRGHTYVGWMNKRIQQTPAKSETHGLGLMTPFGPHTEATMQKPAKRPRIGRTEPLPEPGWSLSDPVRRDDSESDSEMTDNEAEAAMAEAMRAQDRRLEDEARRSAFYEAITRAEEEGARAAYDEGRRIVRNIQNATTQLMEFI